MAPRQVLIVGGGLSGWTTASYLQAALRHSGIPPAEIALLTATEPARSDGVVATVPTIRHLLDVAGIDEIDLLRKTQGTFRHGTRFVNWLRGSGDFFFHPLDRNRAQPIDRAAMDWLRSDRSIAFAESITPQTIISDLGLAPRSHAGQPTGIQLPYAYHLDVAALTTLLRETATRKGVTQHAGQVAEIQRADDGNIKNVLSDRGQRIAADLFIDCSGFSSLIPEQQHGAEWIDCSQWLLCDRKVVLDLDYANHYSGMIRPYTTATALSAGWLCDSPLQNRKTLCYTYSSHFIDDDSARKELLACERMHTNIPQPRTADFKTGHRRSPWIGNCVAVGDAAGSIESLLCTDLYLTELAAILLAEHFPAAGDMAPLAYRYNRIMTNRFYEILDGINLHYCLTKRSDTEFWREVGKAERINDRLKAKLAYWQYKIPSQADFVDQHLPGQPESDLSANVLPGDHRSPVDTGTFLGLEDYECILYGMQFLADECDAWFGHGRPPTRVPRYVINDLQRAPQILPPHATLLREIAGMPDFAVSVGARR